MNKINTFEDFVFFIEKTDLKQQQIETLIQQTINVMVLTPFETEFNKTELITNLKEFWNKWGNKPKTERPFLLTDPLSELLQT